MGNGGTGAGYVKALKVVAGLALAAGIGLMVSNRLFTDEYMKVHGPPDIDKVAKGHEGQSSCAHAAAAEMLAAAKHGTGTSIPARADGIYDDLVHETCCGSGLIPPPAIHDESASGGCDPVCAQEWPSTMLRRWLEKHGDLANTNNRYVLITVRGNLGKEFWRHDDGPRFIGQTLRDCSFVTLSIYGCSAGDGHAVAAWGDDRASFWGFNQNPTLVKLTDSDKDDPDTGSDVQEYHYSQRGTDCDGNAIDGTGWDLDYGDCWDSTRFIRNLVTLSKVDTPVAGIVPIRATSAVRLHQDQCVSATSLSVEAKTEYENPIVNSDVTLDWPNSPSPIQDGDVDYSNEMTELTAKWYFTENPIPNCQWVDLTIEMAVDDTDAVEILDVEWGCGSGSQQFGAPGYTWSVFSPPAPDPQAASATGGYVIGSFSVVQSVGHGGIEPVADYRFVAEYPYSDDPTRHVVHIMGRRDDLFVADVRFGHSYGYPDPAELWVFDEWIDEHPGRVGPFGGDDLTFDLNWHHLLPYPTGEDYVRPKKTPTVVAATPTP